MHFPRHVNSATLSHHNQSAKPIWQTKKKSKEILKKKGVTERKHTKGCFQKIKTSAMNGMNTHANPGSCGSPNLISYDPPKH